MESLLGSLRYTPGNRNVYSLLSDVGSFTWIAGFFGVTFLLLVWKSFRPQRHEMKLPPGPRNWPVVGAMLSMESHMGKWFMKMAKQYGPIFYYRLASHHVVVLSSCEGFEELLKERDAEFADRASATLMRTAAKYVGFDNNDISFARYDDRLKLVRKTCISEYFSVSKLAMYENIRRYEGTVMVQEVMNRVQNEISAELKVKKLLSVCITNILCMVLLGRRYSDAISSETDELRNIRKLSDDFFDLFLKLNLVDVFPWLDWLDPQGIKAQCIDFQRQCRNCFGQILEEHRRVRSMNNHKDDRDFMDILLTLHEDGKITEDSIMGSIVDLVCGGIDTSVTTTEWALVELVKNPETMAKLQKEIDEVVGKDRQMMESDFANLPYLDAVVKEIFRLHNPNPIPSPRLNRSPSTLLGYYIPANTAVFLNCDMTSMDPQIWENPEKFSPDRFIHSLNSTINLISGKNFQLIPFGSGRRMCVAPNLGLLMVKRMLVTLVHAFDWSPPGDKGVDDISAADGDFALIRQLREPLVLSATPRLAATVYK